MPVSTAEELYEMAKQLPVRERLRLVERIAHDLALPSDADVEGDSAPPSGRRAGVTLLGNVTRVSAEPPELTIETARGPVTMRVAPHLLEAAQALLGKEAIVEADAVVDAGGAISVASATALRVSAEADDLLDVFEATFGSGRDVMETPEGRRFLETMRGGDA